MPQLSPIPTRLAAFTMCLQTRATGTFTLPEMAPIPAVGSAFRWLERLATTSLALVNGPRLLALTAGRLSVPPMPLVSTCRATNGCGPRRHPQAPVALVLVRPPGHSARPAHLLFAPPVLHIPRGCAALGGIHRRVDDLTSTLDFSCSFLAGATRLLTIPEVPSIRGRRAARKRGSRDIFAPTNQLPTLSAVSAVCQPTQVARLFAISVMAVVSRWCAARL